MKDRINFRLRPSILKLKKLMSKLFEQLRQLERLDQLIRMKATGSPKALAYRLDVSERQIYRFISELKAMGFPIEYCKMRQSYFYDAVVKISFQLLVNDDLCLKIKGGKKKLFQTDRKWQGEGLTLGMETFS